VTVIPTGTSHARIALFDADTDGEHDLDLYVFRGDPMEGYLVGSSGGATSNETVGLDAPPGDTYSVIVHGYETQGPTASYTLFNWLLDVGHGRKMSITAPHTAREGATGRVKVSWKGLAQNRRYLGAILYCRGTCRSPDDVMGRTFVRVDP
jgi:hypothetical protein